MTQSARSATLLDAFALQGMSFVPVGGPPGGLEWRCSLGRVALACALTVGLHRHRIFVLPDRRHLAGAMHVIASSQAKRWDIVRTSWWPEETEGLVELLQTATVAAACAGVERIVTRLAHDDPRLPNFEVAGFRPYTQETVFGLDLAQSAPERDGLAVRRYSRKDARSLHYLYNAMTPPNVRNMEATTERDFLEPYAHGAGVVVERDGQVLAAGGWLPPRPRDAALLRLLLKADAVTAGEEALLALLQHAVQQGVQRVWLPVRDYTADGMAAARLAGLAPELTRTVLVKHTAALVRPSMFNRLRETPAAIPAVHGTGLVHSGSHVPHCRLRTEGRPPRREAPASVA